MSGRHNWELRFSCEQCTEDEIVAQGKGYDTAQAAEDALDQMRALAVEPWIAEHVGHKAIVISVTTEGEK